MKIHVVKRGETLRDIVRRYSADIYAVIRLNQLGCPDRLAAGQCLVIPESRGTGSGSMEVLAFLRPPLNTDALEESLPCFTYCSRCTHSFSESGELTSPPGGLTASAAREHCCAPLLCLSNLNREGGFSAGLAHRLFTEQALRERLLESIFADLEENEYYGLHLAFNYIFPFDRENYSQFAGELSKELHKRGYILSLELAPKEGAGRSSALSAGLDYEALGRAADRLSLMSCRWAHAFSAPQPLAPADTLRSALDTALSAVPAEKLLMGVSGCGFDWQLPWRQGGQARQLSNSAAAELAAAVGAEIVYDLRDQATGFDYADAEGAPHRVWFEDVRSLQAKLRLAEEYGLAGISLYTADRLYRPLLRLLETFGTVEKLL